MGPTNNDDPEKTTESPLERVLQWGRRDPMTILAIADAGTWLVALPLATIVAHDLQLPIGVERWWAVVVPLAIVVQLLYGLVFGLHMGRRRVASFDEMRTLLLCSASTGGTVAVLLWVVGQHSARAVSTLLVAALLHFVLVAGLRYAGRLMADRARVRSGEREHRILIFGAGDAGEQAAKALLFHETSDALPVAFLDDDANKARLKLRGIPVVGGRAAITDAAARFDADSLLIAMPSANHAATVDVANRAHAAGLRVRILPSAAKLSASQIGLRDIRELTLADYLGRAEVRTDLDSIARYVSGRCVLVTGAGGSIGAELCRALARFRPGRLVMLDRDESALHALQLSLDGKALLDSPDLVLADIRDRRRVWAVMEAIRPQVVFHAAALKHLPLLERNPDEALKTNVLGTLNVLEAAMKVGAERVVNISTDKAAGPTSALGASKRVAERLAATFAGRSSTVFLSTRFGNVLGSRGSVVPAFRAQIENGGPVTITHPDVTRYFMTIEEAVQLVVQAGALGSDGEVLVLDMGEPVRIADLARHLAAELRPGEDVPVVYTGLRTGEKLHEQLFGADEVDRRLVHPSITAVAVAPLPADAMAQLRGAGLDGEGVDARRLIDELVEEDIVELGPGLMAMEDVEVS